MNLPVFPSHPDCRDCGRWEQVPKNPGVPTIAVGAPDLPALVVVGPTPGYHEHIHNEPMVGKPGRLLRSIYLHGLADLCTIYYTYMARCGPNPDAKAREYKCCFTHHLSDMAQILAVPAPQIVVLLLGADTVRHFYRLHLGIRMSHKEAMSQNGKTRIIQSRELPIFSTLHPAAVLRNNSLIHTVEDHIDLLTAHIQGQAPSITDPDIQPARSPHH